MSHIPISEKIKEQIQRTRASLPRPNALDCVVLHPNMLRSWEAELIAIAGYAPGRPSGLREFWGLAVMEDERLPVNGAELRAGSRTIARFTFAH